MVNFFLTSNLFKCVCMTRDSYFNSLVGKSLENTIRYKTTEKKVCNKVLDP